MAKKTEMVLANVLVLDHDIHAKLKINQFDVSNMVKSLEADCRLPPVVACRRTNRVHDGRCRVSAAIKHYGDEATVDVEYRDFVNDGEALVFSVEANVAQGTSLTPFEKKSVIARAADYGIPVWRMAKAVRVTTKRAQELLDYCTAPGPVASEAPADATPDDSGRVPLKGPLTWINRTGNPLTPEQKKCNEKIGGMSVVFYVNTIITLIESGSIDSENEKIIERLRHLKDVLNKTEYV